MDAESSTRRSKNARTSGRSASIPRPARSSAGRNASSAGALTDVDWSPGGERLVLVQRSEPWESLAVIRADGSGYARITDASVQHRRPRWCPRAGSERILFHSNEFLATVLSDGSALRMIDARSDSATWSGDGEKVVVKTYDARWTPAGLAQYEIDPEGVALRLEWSVQEPAGSRLVSMEDWSPDGRRVLASGGDPDLGFFMIDMSSARGESCSTLTTPRSFRPRRGCPTGSASCSRWSTASSSSTPIRAR
jgi:hypothetical protein